jgi:hypothetical protein
LERLLASPLFRHSNRYPKLLRFSVEAALENPDQHPKERFVGVTIFGRDPDYDTNLDPIVRTTAVEVRKRIAEYYRQQGRDGELRIDLPAGSYVAEIRESSRSGDVSLDLALPTVVSIANPPVAESSQPPLHIHPFPRRRLLIAACLVLSGIISVLAWNSFHTDALETFWKPILQSPGDVTFVIPKAPAIQTAADSIPQPDRVGLPAATSMAMISGLLHASKKPWRVRMSPMIDLAELREGPLVLIGAFNNQWTLRLTESLRFGFVRAPGFHAIVDHQNPSRKWAADPPDVTEDYGLVASTIDRTTGERVVIAAGLWQWGSTAATEFITEPAHMQELARLAPRGWEDRNLEVVVATKVIGESSGPPRIVATYFW